jgi:hypothetical protein
MRVNLFWLNDEQCEAKIRPLRRTASHVIPDRAHREKSICYMANRLLNRCGFFFLNARKAIGPGDRSGQGQCVDRRLPEGRGEGSH